MLWSRWPAMIFFKTFLKKIRTVCQILLTDLSSTSISSSQRFWGHRLRLVIADFFVRFGDSKYIRTCVKYVEIPIKSIDVLLVWYTSEYNFLNWLNTHSKEIFSCSKDCYGNHKSTCKKKNNSSEPASKKLCDSSPAASKESIYYEIPKAQLDALCKYAILYVM